MLNSDERMILHKAIEIAASYLVRKGCEEAVARARAGGHVGCLFAQGERRPLVLANRAIEQIELGNRVADELRTIDLTGIFSWPA